MYDSLLRRETGVGCKWTLIPRPDAILRKDTKYWTKMILKYTTQNYHANSFKFDVTDPNRHYADIVPLRAAKNPLLLYAMCTASARYLYQLHSQSNLPGVIEYNGVKLPKLSERSSVLYHNICISYLRGMANDPTALQSGDVLAAITILRFHEQVDSRY